MLGQEENLGGCQSSIPVLLYQLRRFSVHLSQTCQVCRDLTGLFREPVQRFDADGISADLNILGQVALSASEEPLRRRRPLQRDRSTWQSV